MNFYKQSNLSFLCFLFLFVACSSNNVTNPDKTARISILANQNLIKLSSQIDNAIYFQGSGNAKNTDQQIAEKTAKMLALRELSRNIIIEVNSIIKSYEKELVTNSKVYKEESLDTVISLYSKSKIRDVKYDYIVTEKSGVFVYDVVAFKNKKKYFDESRNENLLNIDESGEIENFILDYLQKNQ